VSEVWRKRNKTAVRATPQALLREPAPKPLNTAALNIFTFVLKSRGRRSLLFDFPGKSKSSPRPFARQFPLFPDGHFNQ